MDLVLVPQKSPGKCANRAAKDGVDNMAVKRRNRYYPRVRKFPSFNSTTNTIVKGATTVATVGILGAMTAGIVGSLLQK